MSRQPQAASAPSLRRRRNTLIRGLAATLATALLMVACGQPQPGVDAEPAPPEPTAPAEPAEPAEDGEEPADPEPTPQPPAGPSQASATQAPWNGAWIHLFDGTLTSRASIEAAVVELAAAGADTIIAQVARRHDAYYHSDVLTRTTDPRVDPSLDVLEVLTDAAHLRGMRVHAWISVAPTWHAIYEDLAHPDDWLVTRHGLLAAEEDRWVTRTFAGTWDEYLDPALPQVREHVAAVVTEIVDRYPVDGIHLDYVRYASEQHGYHPEALDRFAAATGITELPDPLDPVWTQWRQEQTTELVAHVASVLREHSRSVALSAAVVAWGAPPNAETWEAFSVTRPAQEALQPWPQWVESGLVDAIVPMNYFRAHVEEQASWFEGWLAFQAALATRSDALVVAGIGGWLNEPDAVIAQANAAAAATDGVIVYSYQQPTADESREVWDLLAQGVWRR